MAKEEFKDLKRQSPAAPGFVVLLCELLQLSFSNQCIDHHFDASLVLIAHFFYRAKQ